MTSTVTDTISGLDLTYPVAGVNNDTQGFRDAYIKINQAFTATANEITNLQLQINNIASTSSIFASAVATTVTNLVLSNITATLTATVVSINSSTGVSTYSKFPVASSRGQTGDKKGMIYANGNYIYMCYADYTTGNTDIWARVQTTSTGLTSWP